MREIVLDTETTGLDPLMGHRVVEIGCVELLNHVFDRQDLSRLFESRTRCADRSGDGAWVDRRISDRQTRFLPQTVDDFLNFIGDTPFVIHNATFDMNFINAELTRCGYKRLPMDRATDTVMMARKKFPGAPASLDALCKRFGVDLSTR